MVLRISILSLMLSAAVLLPAGRLHANPSPSSDATGRSTILHNLLEEALTNNQGLRALELRIAALRDEVHAAGALDDPRMGFGMLNVPTDTYRLDQEPMTQKQITLAQRIPWFGKLDLKTRRAALNVMRLETTLTAKRHLLIRDLSEAFYELGFVAASQDINERMISQLDQIVRFAETRYGAGKGLQQDVLQAQVEQSRLMDESNTLQRQRRTLEDRINGLLNRGGYLPITPPEPDGLPDLQIDAATWQKAALMHNPDLKSLQVEIDQAAVDFDLARKGYYPDPDLVLSYGQRDDDRAGRDRADFVSASVVFTLPVWAKNKQDRQLEAAGKRREAARSQYQDMAAQLPHRIDAMAVELDQIRTSYMLYKQTILVQADQWAQSALNAYEVGKVDFGTMLSAQLRVLALERQTKQYQFQYYRKLSGLDEILGGRLNPTPIFTPKED